MTIHDTSVHVLAAVASIGALGRENDQLVKATAKQAATVRTQQQRISEMEAEVTLEKYNVEFLKHQGRKTRAKNRETKQRLAQSRNHLAQALRRAERAEQANAILRAQLSQLMQDHRDLQRLFEMRAYL